MTATRKLPSYTKQEAWHLEDIYLRGYKAEGLIGKGRVPANDNVNRAPFCITPAGKARQEKSNAAKERAYELVVQGHDTANAIMAIMNCTASPVRRYLRMLEKEGRIEVKQRKTGGLIKWQVKHPVSSLSSPVPHLERAGDDQENKAKNA